MKKRAITTLLLILTTADLSAVVWSKTSMEIAITQIPSMIAPEMEKITAKTEQINTKFKSSITKSIATKDEKTFIIQNLEGEILLELKRMKETQNLINKIEVHND
ncbi:MAG: hypothetical protein A3F91_09505 [Flavobacteria bacterium RIFCSPLOWO2_12_FULL_35_11]|nr:MAG: hypothetical protein A3F91_09505 [Flavobacteria bacterium RIFCSPLOWO2_12_FULL_35_11]